MGPIRTGTNVPVNPNLTLGFGVSSGKRVHAKAFGPRRPLGRGGGWSKIFRLAEIPGRNLKLDLDLGLKFYGEAEL